jgi:hypothetical protein
MFTLRSLLHHNILDDPALRVNDAQLSMFTSALRVTRLLNARAAWTRVPPRCHDENMILDFGFATSAGAEAGAASPPRASAAAICLCSSSSTSTVVFTLSVARAEENFVFLLPSSECRCPCAAAAAGTPDVTSNLPNASITSERNTVESPRDRCMASSMSR